MLGISKASVLACIEMGFLDFFIADKKASIDLLSSY